MNWSVQPNVRQGVQAEEVRQVLTADHFVVFRHAIALLSTIIHMPSPHPQLLTPAVKHHRE